MLAPGWFRRRGIADNLSDIRAIRLVALTRLNLGSAGDRNPGGTAFRILPFGRSAQSVAVFCRINCRLEYVDGFRVTGIGLVRSVVE